jgi:hypothetical protein
VSISERLKNALKEFTSFEEKGVNPIISRYGEVDIAYPANEEEYCALGGHSVAKVVTISEKHKELPIERAYFQLTNEKIMNLTKLRVCVDDGILLADKVKKETDDKDRVYFKNSSFWLIPTSYFLIDGGFIAVDFKEGRKSFVILRGPWNINSQIDEWIKKHTTGRIEISDNVGHDQVATFIGREFFSSSI